MNHFEKALVKNKKAEHHAILKIAKDQLSRIEEKIAEALQQKDFFSVDEIPTLLKIKLTILQKKLED